MHRHYGDIRARFTERHVETLDEAGRNERTVTGRDREQLVFACPQGGGEAGKGPGIIAEAIGDDVVGIAAISLRIAVGADHEFVHLWFEAGYDVFDQWLVGELEEALVAPTKAPTGAAGEDAPANRRLGHRAHEVAR